MNQYGWSRSSASSADLVDIFGFLHEVQLAVSYPFVCGLRMLSWRRSVDVALYLGSNSGAIDLNIKSQQFKMVGESRDEIQINSEPVTRWLRYFFVEVGQSVETYLWSQNAAVMVCVTTRGVPASKVNIDTGTCSNPRAPWALNDERTRIP